MTTSRRIQLAVCGIAALIVTQSPAHSADTPSTQPAGRTIEQIRKDMMPAVMGILPVYKAHKDWSDPDKRKELAPQAQPNLKKAVTLLEETESIGQSRPGDVNLIVEMSDLFGDDELRSELDKFTSNDKPEAHWAKAAELGSRFYQANGQTDAQNKVVDQMQQLARTDSTAHNSLAWAATDAWLNGQPVPAVKTRLDDFVTNTLHSKSLDQYKQMMAAEEKQKSLENKPLVLTGPLRDGTAFTSESMKGKVILIDFWASWCGPCKAELPRVKKAYADFHDKGLEVLGVSCDQTKKDLDNFLAKNPDMPWPQMFDDNKPGWHALARRCGVEAIPTMFLIDKKGICRTVSAREDFETEIPKLLAEPTAPAVQ